MLPLRLHALRTAHVVEAVAPQVVTATRKLCGPMRFASKTTPQGRRRTGMRRARCGRPRRRRQAAGAQRGCRHASPSERCAADRASTRGACLPRVREGRACSWRRALGRAAGCSARTASSASEPWRWTTCAYVSEEISATRHPSRLRRTAHRRCAAPIPGRVGDRRRKSERRTALADAPTAALTQRLRTEPAAVGTPQASARSACQPVDQRRDGIGVAPARRVPVVTAPICTTSGVTLGCTTSCAHSTKPCRVRLLRAGPRVSSDPPRTRRQLRHRFARSRCAAAVVRCAPGGTRTEIVVVRAAAIEDATAAADPYRTLVEAAKVTPDGRPKDVWLTSFAEQGGACRGRQKLKQLDIEL